MKKIITLVIGLVFLAGCQQSVLPAFPTDLPDQPFATQSLNPAVQEPTFTPQTPIPSTTPFPPPENTRYTIKAVFNYGLHHLAVDQEIVYTNNYRQQLADLMMMVEPDIYPGVFHLKSLAWEDGQTVIEYALSANMLRIPLLQPLNPGQKIQLHLSYELHLPAIPEPADDRRPVPFGYTDHQVNLVDWYPTIPPYQSGVGWLAHKPWFYGEHQVYETADFQVEIQTVNPPPGMILAASAIAVQNGSTYTFSQQNARNFVWSASPYYKLFTQQVGNFEIKSYAFTFDSTAGKAALQYTAQAFELYNKLFSPYTHATLTVVEADFLDGMEYDGLYFLSRGFYNLYGGTPQGYLAAIAAHETSHQWWYAQVANDQALEPWLDESLATYTEYIFYKNLYPNYLQWWWDYRVDYYNPTGFINLQLYDYSSYRGYRDAVYLNGAHFMNDLRTKIGDETFVAFLHDYAVTYAGHLVGADDFFSLLNKHSSVDISEITKKYFK
jgi:hypothetical protein